MASGSSGSYSDRSYDNTRCTACTDDPSSTGSPRRLSTGSPSSTFGRVPSLPNRRRTIDHSASAVSGMHPTPSTNHERGLPGTSSCDAPSVRYARPPEADRDDRGTAVATTEPPAAHARPTPPDDRDRHPHQPAARPPSQPSPRPSPSSSHGPAGRGSRDHD